MRSLNVSIVFLILLVLVVLIPVLIGVYVYRDARRRGMNAALWTLIAILAPSLIGFIIYLLVRGNYSDLRCPRCETQVTEQYVVCPKCGAKLRPGCPKCSMPVEPDWTVCPRCAQPLPRTMVDIVAPVRPKDKVLWKILIAIIMIPAVLILTLGISFSAASSAGSSSLMEVSFEDYYSDQEIPESTKAYIQKWQENISGDEVQVYALCYEWQSVPESDRKEYLYLLYIPGSGATSHSGFGYSEGLFSSTFELDLEGADNQDRFYCVATTGDKGMPKLKVTLDGKKLTAHVTAVDFNPTPFMIASESDYSSLTNASGDLYVEEMEKEMLPDLVIFTKIADGQEVDRVDFKESDFLLNTVVGIHELEYLDESPAFLDGYTFSDYYTITIHYADTTGSAYYEDSSDYRVIEEAGSYYIIESASELVYQITDKAYYELEALF